MRPNIENFIGCDSSYRAASIVLYGAPYDSTTSYRPGARFGPAAIRHESYGLETYSPYQNADLTDFDVFDSGDLELLWPTSRPAPPRSCTTASSRCCWAASIWSRWARCGLR